MPPQFWSKLQHKPWYQRLCIRMPQELRETFDTHDDDLLLDEATYIHEVGEEDAVIIFLRDQEEFLTYVKWFDHLMKSKQLFWIAYPREGSIRSDLSRDKLSKLMQNLGRDVMREIVLNETWAATRFKYLKSS